MVESSKKCPACGSVLRPNAVFCHHCGRSLTNSESDLHVGATQGLSSENLPVENETVLAETSTVIKTTAPAAPVGTLERIENTNGAGAIADINETSRAKNTQSDTAIKKPAQQQVTRRAKRYVSRTEYVWEESSAPTVRIMLFSLLALLLVALLLWLNNFLR